MKINCEVRQASSNVDAKNYDTGRIRQEYLVQNLMVADEINMVYSMFDRIIAGGAVPVKENLLLSAYDHGVSSCWLTAPAQAHMTGEIRDEFAPGHGELVAIAVLGYAADGFNPKAPKRKEGKYTFI